MRITLLLAFCALLAIPVASEQRRRSPGLLNVGDKAPNFKVKALNKEDTFELASNFGVRPTVLIFGSYT